MVDIEKAVREVLEDLKCGPNGAERDFVSASHAIEPFEVLKKLEHSLLTLGLTRDELLAECKMVRTVQAGAICVAPYYVPDAVGILSGSSVVVCAAVGFPGSYMSTEAKIADVRACIMRGAGEIDLAINVAAVKSGDFAKAEKDFLGAVDVARGRAVVKAVFEHAAYDEREKEEVLRMIGRSGVAFIKIQNVVSGHGARAEEIRLVQSVLGDRIKIKIDGGVKTLEKATEILRAGAHRIGLTATKAIAEETGKK